MQKEDRKKASVDMTGTYLQSYYQDWRLAKVLTNKKLLTIKYEFFKDIANDLKQEDDLDGEATIAQEIRNGFYFDTIAQCVQYVEDLFAMIRAAEQPDFFIRNIVTYKAGEITSFIKRLKVTSKSCSKIFRYPLSDGKLPAEIQSIYNESSLLFETMLTDICKFYEKYEFFYNQYKHGLSIAMRPFGNKYNVDQVRDEKNGDFDPYLAVYDNLNLKAAASKGTFTPAHGLLMPAFSDNIRGFISELSNENNFLKFVFPPDYPNFTFELLEDHARKVRCCINIFIFNYWKEISYSGRSKEFQLPKDFRTNECIIFKYNPDATSS